MDLEEVWGQKSWRWFTARVAVLLNTDNPLARAVAPPPQSKAGGDGGDA